MRTCVCAVCAVHVWVRASVVWCVMCACTCACGTHRPCRRARSWSAPSRTCCSPRTGRDLRSVSRPHPLLTCSKTAKHCTRTRTHFKACVQNMKPRVHASRCSCFSPHARCHDRGRRVVRRSSLRRSRMRSASTRT